MRKVAVVGIGSTGFRSATPEVSYKELMYEAAVRAYDDAGIDARRDIGSAVTVAEDFWEGTSIFDEYVPDQIGAARKPVHTISGDGLQGLAAAAMQVSAGLVDVAVVEGHSKSSDILTLNRIYELALDPITVRPLGANPFVYAGLEMARYLHEGGATEEGCAAVAARNRRQALKNPHAAYGAKQSAGDVLCSGPVSSPLKRGDAGAPADGAIVMVLASVHRAKELGAEPVWLRGIGWATETPAFDSRSWDTADYCVRAASQAYRMAGIRKPGKELCVAEVDDTFSYKEMMHLEALGLCRRGEATDFALGGGETVVNPSGGCLGMGYPFEASGLQRAYEVVLQLRGEAGRRQVKGAEAGVAQSWRGIPTATGAVAVFGR